MYKQFFRFHVSILSKNQKAIYAIYFMNEIFAGILYIQGKNNTKKNGFC